VAQLSVALDPVWSGGFWESQGGGPVFVGSPWGLGQELGEGCFSQLWSFQGCKECAGRSGFC
jgi:hypothetical protein